MTPRRPSGSSADREHVQQRAAHLLRKYPGFTRTRIAISSATEPRRLDLQVVPRPSGTAPCTRAARPRTPESSGSPPRRSTVTETVRQLPVQRNVPAARCTSLVQNDAARPRHSRPGSRAPLSGWTVAGRQRARTGAPPRSSPCPRPRLRAADCTRSTMPFPRGDDVHQRLRAHVAGTAVAHPVGGCEHPCRAGARPVLAVAKPKRPPRPSALAPRPRSAFVTPAAQQVQPGARTGRTVPVARARSLAAPRAAERRMARGREASCRRVGHGLREGPRLERRPEPHRRDNDAVRRHLVVACVGLSLAAGKRVHASAPGTSPRASRERLRRGRRARCCRARR